jgi:hypothetical protein
MTACLGAVSVTGASAASEQRGEAYM